jgi:hypothetical protein
MTLRQMTSIERLACRVRLGLADWREVERVGLDELEGGASHPEIVALAAVTSETPGLEALVDAAVVAIGEQVPSEVDAAMGAAADAAEEIVAGTVTPVAGARELWRLARRVPEVEPQVRPFVAFASEWEDDEVNRPRYESDIVEAARRLLARFGAETS